MIYFVSIVITLFWISVGNASTCRNAFALSAGIKAAQTLKQWREVFGTAQAHQYQLHIFQIFLEQPDPNSFINKATLISELRLRTGLAENSIIRYLKDWVKLGFAEKDSSVGARANAYRLTPAAFEHLAKFSPKG